MQVPKNCRVWPWMVKAGAAGGIIRPQNAGGCLLLVEEGHGASNLVSATIDLSAPDRSVDKARAPGPVSLSNLLSRVKADFIVLTTPNRLHASLALPLSGQAEARCEHTGDRYRLEGERVILLEN